MIRRLLIGAATVVAFEVLFSQAAGAQAIPCSDPNGCPNLTAQISGQILRKEQFSTKSCAFLEGMVKAGRRWLLRFTTTYPNAGPGDLIVGAPAANPQAFEFSTCHGHYHFKDYADYRLWTPQGYQQWQALKAANPGALSAALLAANPGVAAQMVRGDKEGFCVIDVVKIDPNAGPAKYTDCGTDQGITVGYADVYGSQLDGQWIDVTDVANGQYVLEVEVNAEHLFEEADYDDNSTAVPVTINKRGR